MTTKKQWTNKCIDLMGHKYFFYGILGITVLQGLWYALSVSPTFFDEQRHIGFIQLYLDHISPFITSQKPAWDALGEVTRDPSYFFYWLMSWPLRFISFFTPDFEVQVIFLRLICIGLFGWGMYLYRKVFLEIGISRAITHAVLLIFILAPTIALYPGSVHYDNLIFPLFALTLLYALRMLQGSDVSFQQLALLLSIGMFGTVIKFTFAALFAPIFIFVCVNVWQRFGRHSFTKLKYSMLALSRLKQAGLILLLIVSAGLFIERPVVNILVFHQIQPDCIKRIGKERCMKNYTAERNITLQEQKPEHFLPQNPFEYSLQAFSPYMLFSHVSFATNLRPLPIMTLLYYGFVFATPVLILLYLRDFLRNKLYAFLLFVASGYSLLLFLYLYVEYIKYGLPVATSSRYMVQVIPIFMLFAGLGLYRLLQKRRTALLSLFIITLLAHTQGGSISTYLVQANPQLDWSNSAIRKINGKLRSFVSIVIRKNGPFIR
jgi:hypothetical protein